MKMKSKISLLAAAAVLVFAQGCNNILEEHPKDRFTAAYYETRQGFQDGINAAYASLRFQYGTNPAMGLNVVGTDEFTFGPEPNYNPSGDNLPHKQFTRYEISPTLGFLTVTYNRTFPIINLLNGLIEAEPKVTDFGITERANVLGEVRYLRAHYYYFLVVQFGASPLDLGGGELKFNRNAFNGFNRLDPDLLRKNFQVMIDDLTFASENLPDVRPAGAFKLSKAVALHLLAKIYLFRAYSSVTPNAQQDFQSAYNTAKQLIDGRATYGTALQTDFGDIYKEGNDYNSEILLSAERIPGNQLNNEYPSGGPSGIGDRECMASSCFTSNYEQPMLLRPSGGDPIDGRPFAFQRPLRKMAPTKWLLHTAFADKTNDSRYHNSFRTVFTCATQNAVGTAGYTTFVNALAAMVPSRVIGDTAFFLADTQAQAVALRAKNPYYRVYGPDEYYDNQLFPGPPAPTNVVLVYPSLKKFNDTNRANPNDASGRPMPIFKLGETYLLAAEAAMQIGNNTEARDLINVIRTRAAYRPSRAGMNAAQNTAANTAAVAAITAATPATIDLNFILDERARETCGENLRWADLAMRGDDVFINRVKLNPDATGVQTFHRLRPIPQQQLDAINDPDKAKYQNPGY